MRVDDAGRPVAIRRLRTILCACAVPALAAGTALVLSGCGGVLGSGGSAVIRALVPAACTIDAANLDNQNYSTAITNKQNGFSFDGTAQDDLLAPAVRRRVFAQRLADVKAKVAEVAHLAPATSDETRLVAATRHDLRVLRAQLAYDLRWAPGDPKAPNSPEAFATDLSDLIDSGEFSKGVTAPFGTCTLPADVTRRSKAYGTL